MKLIDPWTGSYTTRDPTVNFVLRDSFFATRFQSCIVASALRQSSRCSTTRPIREGEWRGNHV